MHSFELSAVGRLTRKPELVAQGDTVYTRLCLANSDYTTERDPGVPGEVLTSVWLLAFGALGEALARHCRKGDQLVVEAILKPNDHPERSARQHPGHIYVVQGFRFAAPGEATKAAQAVWLAHKAATVSRGASSK